MKEEENMNAAARARNNALCQSQRENVISDKKTGQHFPSPFKFCSLAAFDTDKIYMLILSLFLFLSLSLSVGEMNSLYDYRTTTILGYTEECLFVVTWAGQKDAIHFLWEILVATT
jgi:hypothetical protein